MAEASVFLCSNAYDLRDDIVRLVDCTGASSLLRWKAHSLVLSLRPQGGMRSATVW